MNVALLGYGVVGKGVADLIEKHPEYGVHLTRILVHRKEQAVSVNMTDDINEILNDSSIEVVMECIGGDEPAHTYCLNAIQKGKHVITANKKMLSVHYDELAKCAYENHVSLRFSASCGGGIPWIRNLEEIAKKETIYSVEGIMNGTSNYILDKIFRGGRTFEEALREAQELGYAEKDPSDDIDGIDTRAKTVLSANIAFQKAFDPNDVLALGIRYFSNEEYKYCINNRRVCVLKGIIQNHGEKVSLAVLPFFEEMHSLFASVHENYNCFLLNSETRKQLAFIGEGAGRYPTASNMIDDLLSLLRNEEFRYLPSGKGSNAEEALSYRFYIRSKDNKAFESLIEKEVGEDTYITRAASLQELREALERNNDKEIFIAGISHD